MNRIVGAAIGDRIVDPVGIVHMIKSIINNLDDEAMFIGTTCAERFEYIGKCGELSQESPTCLACVMGRPNHSYTGWLYATIENVAFIQRDTGGIDMVKDRIALDKLTERLKNVPEQINNSTLYAGSPMYFYCRLCNWLADVKPESYSDRPRSHYKECEELKKANPKLTDSTLKEFATKLRK
jgi:hypothetical protein